MSKTLQGKIVIRNAILSYPALLQPKDYKNDKNFRFKANFLVEDKEPTITYAQTAKSALWENKTLIKLDTEISGRSWVISSACQAEQPPHLYAMSHGKDGVKARKLDREKDAEQIAQIFYGGAFVDGIISAYLNKNNALCFGLKGVCFVRDGEHLGGGMIDPEEMADDFNANAGSALAATDSAVNAITDLSDDEDIPF